MIFYVENPKESIKELISEFSKVTGIKAIIKILAIKY